MIEFSARELRESAASVKNALEDFYMEQFEKDEELKKIWLGPMVRVAESMEREADELSGFTKAQKMVSEMEQKTNRDY